MYTCVFRNIIILCQLILQCSAVEKHFTYGVKEFGTVRGADKIKAEIYARGPVSCGIDATSKLEQYTGGIFSEFKLIVMINHELSVRNLHL